MGNSAKELDQFFTQDEVAKTCLDKITSILKQLNYDTKKTYFVEPSAGDGAFCRALRDSGNNFSAYDIDKKQDYIKQNDYLQTDISTELPRKENVVIIGNPPFGKRAKLAVDFINISFRYSNTVAFILPLQFNKYSAQKQINPLANLVYNERLNEESFLFEGKKYSVRCCLQIWTTKKTLPDMRLRQPPQIQHRDFEMWQYNNTREAEKYFDKSKYHWDFAVPRQGYKDYTIKETDPKKMDKRTQWIFFRAKNANARRNLMRLDFEKLSHKNTSTPGFGKADVIEAYNEMLNNYNLETSSTQTFQLGEPNPSFAETLPLFASTS